MSQRGWLTLILVLYLSLGVLYSLSTPPLEASDEFKHYPYVRYVQTHRDLPVLDLKTCLQASDDCPWLQDGGQPPLYYILVAAATSWIDTSDLHELRWMNWHAFIGDPSQVCNKNLIIHIPERESFPWRGAVLAIHLIRLLTLGFGAATVALTYLLACELFPNRPSLALGAAALTAFNPMFLFVNAAVNNDALAALMGNLFLFLVVRLARDGVRGPVPLWRYGVIGVTTGLFLLTKLSGLAALILLGAVLVWVSYRRRSLRPLIAGFPIVLAISLGISGWWFARNWRLYGDPTALNAFVTIQGVRPGAPTLRDWWAEFGTFRWTYWGLFGAVNVMAPQWVYVFFDTVTVLALGGLLRATVRRLRRPAGVRPRPGDDPSALSWIPAIWAIILFISVLRWTWIYFSFQGRLVFPAVAGINTLLLVGLQRLAPRQIRPAATLGLAAAMLAIATALPLVSIRPAYDDPEPLTIDDLPADVRVEPIDVGGGIRVIGRELPFQAVRPGESVEIVVYWEAVAPDGGDYVTFARLLGQDHELVGDVNRRPACGMVPTSLWRSGQVWQDPYRVRVRTDARAPTALRVEVGLYDPQRGETLGVADLGLAKLAPPRCPSSVGRPLEVALTDGISLLGYDVTPDMATPGEVVTLTLHWKADATPMRNYQVFVHLVGDGLEPAAQGDGPPVGGNYPTGLWAAGECITDPHQIVLPTDLPPGPYRFIVGMYDLTTMERLARGDGAGDAIELPVPLRVLPSDPPPRDLGGSHPGVSPLGCVY